MQELIDKIFLLFSGIIVSDHEHKDNYWADPDIFRAEQFIHALDGIGIVKTEHFVAFGQGFGEKPGRAPKSGILQNIRDFRTKVAVCAKTCDFWPKVAGSAKEQKSATLAWKTSS